MTTLALLIDGDNAQLTSAKHILQFCGSRGTLTIKKAYGDWEKPPLSSHRQTMIELGIKPIQQNRVTPNATDFRLTMDVAVMLEKKGADIYVLVSSDNHFTVMCEQIGQKGVQVIGIGSKNSISSKLQKACNEFYDIEEIVKNPSYPLSRASTSPKNKPTVQAKSKSAPKSKVTASPTPKTQGKDSKSAATIPSPKIVAASKLPSKSAAKTTVIPKSQQKVEAKSKVVSKSKPDAAAQPKTKAKVKVAPHPKVEPNPAAMLEILIEAYRKAPKKDGGVDLAQLGKKLRQVDEQFEQRFAGKKLSTWCKGFKDTFVVVNNRVRMK